MAEIHELEVAVALPTFAGSPLKRTAKKTAIQPERLVLDVAGLYWGVHRMLHALLGDPAEVVKADDMARKLVEASARGAWDRPSSVDLAGKDMPPPYAYTLLRW